MTTLPNLIDSINRVRKCATPACEGILLVGIGGSIDVIYVCNGCGTQIHYTGCDITRSLGAITSLGPLQN